MPTVNERNLGAASGYASLGGPVYVHSIDLVERGLAAKFFRKLVASFIIDDSLCGMELQVFALLPEYIFGKPLPTADLRELLLDESTCQKFLGVPIKFILATIMYST